MRVFKIIEKYFVVLILLAVILSFFSPNMFSWVLGSINGFNILNILLGVILFGMGTTLQVSSFVNVFKRPKEVLIGISIQYI
ncbi:MAG: bile acid:sodium symporter family protein, partial [Methanosphaera stadtmanae]|nr:bile acid:sodium symporter family protein [Methanosphaera stadtmanae]